MIYRRCVLGIGGLLFAGGVGVMLCAMLDAGVFTVRSDGSNHSTRIWTFGSDRSLEVPAGTKPRREMFLWGAGFAAGGVGLLCAASPRRETRPAGCG